MALFNRTKDIVNDFDGAAKSLESALSVQLNPQAAQSDRELHKRHATTSSHASSIGRWRTELSGEEIDVLASALGEEIRSLGFQA